MERPPIGSFNYPTGYRIGCGRIAELGSATRELAIARPLLVSDPGVVGLPWFGRVRRILGESGLEPVVFSAVRANPGEREVVDGVAAYHAGGCDGVLTIGGGSAMDVAKCIALMVGNAGSVFDYEDVGDNWKRVKAEKVPPILAVPTTSGTGSEVGRASVIVDERDHSKKIVFHPRMQPRLVIADPELTFDLPAHVTAATGMDALAHCFEAYCAPGYHPMADGIALEGIRLVDENLRTAVAHGHDAVARTHMAMAASMGATAFQKGLGLVHALSHPLGGMTGIHHGLANAIFLPYVMAYNRAEIEAPMVRLSRYLGLAKPGFDGALTWMLELRGDLGLPHTLAEVNPLSDDQIRTISDMATRDPSLGSNPRPADVDQIEAVLRNTLNGSL